MFAIVPGKSGAYVAGNAKRKCQWLGENEWKTEHSPQNQRQERENHPFWKENDSPGSIFVFGARSGSLFREKCSCATAQSVCQLVHHSPEKACEKQPCGWFIWRWETARSGKRNVVCWMHQVQTNKVHSSERCVIFLLSMKWFGILFWVCGVKDKMGSAAFSRCQQCRYGSTSRGLEAFHVIVQFRMLKKFLDSTTRHPKICQGGRWIAGDQFVSRFGQILNSWNLRPRLSELAFRSWGGGLDPPGPCHGFLLAALSGFEDRVEMLKRPKRMKKRLRMIWITWPKTI